MYLVYRNAVYLFGLGCCVYQLQHDVEAFLRVGIFDLVVGNSGHSLVYRLSASRLVRVAARGHRAPGRVNDERRT